MTVVAADHFAVIFEYADRGRWMPHGNKLYRIKVGIGGVPSPKTFRPAVGAHPAFYSMGTIVLQRRYVDSAPSGHSPTYTWRRV